ncbi:MAG: hypothetical protein OXB88_06115 [Bacteriovoracales bacterium]|nr:hypothetical protein [Bacteriovoracales bacterium]
MKTTKLIIALSLTLTSTNLLANTLSSKEAVLGEADHKQSRVGPDATICDGRNLKGKKGGEGKVASSKENRVLQ